VSIERLATQPTPLFTGTLRADVFLMKMYQSLKCSDEETGKCASNLMIEDKGQFLAHEGYAHCWCPSSVWLRSRDPCSRVPFFLFMKMYQSLKCSDEKTGKCALNLMIEDEGQVFAHEGYAVSWCLSSVWLPSGHPFSRVPYVFKFFL
jgi:hypothetical protein